MCARATSNASPQRHMSFDCPAAAGKSLRGLAHDVPEVAAGHHHQLRDEPAPSSLSSMRGSDVTQRRSHRTRACTRTFRHARHRLARRRPGHCDCRARAWRSSRRTCAGRRWCRERRYPQLRRWFVPGARDRRGRALPAWHASRLLALQSPRQLVGLRRPAMTSSKYFTVP